MIPHQNPRNTSRTQPSALHFSQGSDFLTQRSAPPTTPAPAAPSPQNDAFRADYKPSFSPQTASAPRQQSVQPAPTRSAAPQTVSEQYNLARQQLTNFAPQEGFATEKQRRDFAWEVRSDPLGARDKAQEFQRMYQRQPSPQSTPTRRANFNGPRPRFTP